MQMRVGRIVWKRRIAEARTVLFPAPMAFSLILVLSLSKDAHSRSSDACLPLHFALWRRLLCRQHSEPALISRRTTCERQLRRLHRGAPARDVGFPRGIR